MLQQEGLNSSAEVFPEPLEFPAGMLDAVAGVEEPPGAARRGQLDLVGRLPHGDDSGSEGVGRALARQATQTCIDVLGACGLSAEHLPEKAFRDARIFDIYEGTGEIQRLIIARDLLGYSPKELN